MSPTKARETFIATLAREYASTVGTDIVHVARLLLRQSGYHLRLMEARGSPMNEAQRSWFERREATIESHIRLLCNDNLPRCVPSFSADVLGGTVKLYVPSGYCDDWSGTGIVVPTSVRPTRAKEASNTSKGERP